MVYFGESPVDVHGLSVWASRHVAEGQRAGKSLRRGLELSAQDVGKAALLSLDDAARVMSDQPAQHPVGVLDVAQVAGAIEPMQAGSGQLGQIADVVQPRGDLQESGVSAESRCQAAGSRGDTLDVCPAAGERDAEKRPGEIFSPGGKIVHVAKARLPTRDAHGRSGPSGDV